MSTLSTSARVHVLLARDANMGVVFRRGPSKQVRLSVWNTAEDSFEHGQWLKGRVYDHRCDLTPSGDLLVYFGSKPKADVPQWTAISRPPFFTALAFFPKVMGCWGGGGLFPNPSRLDLNHWPQNQDAQGPLLPKKLQVHPLGKYSGRGEDDPIRELRLVRDGWRILERGHFVHRGSLHPVSFEGTTPRVFEKPNPKCGELMLRRRWLGFGERQGPWEMLEHDVCLVDGDSTVVHRLGRTEWADWDKNGDLLESRAGCLYRRRLRGKALLDPVLVADLNQASFERVLASKEARRWPSRFR